MTDSNIQIFDVGPHRAGTGRLKKWTALDGVLKWALVLAVFGYPMIATLPIFLSLETRVFSVPYRAFVIALTVLALLLSLLNRRHTRIPMYVLALISVSCLILILRFSNETFARNLAPGPTQTVGEFTLFFLGVTLFPALALCLPIRVAIEKSIYRSVLVFGSATVALVVFAALFLNPVIDPTLRADLEGLNAISYATTGATLILLIWPVMVGGTKSMGTWVISIAAVTLGLIPLLTAASRGPLVSLLIVLATFHVVSNKGKRLKSILLILAAAGAIATGMGDWLSAMVESGDQTLALARRVTDISGDSSTVERLIILNSSWDVFIANPLIGGAMVEPVLHAYPHNILLEALMVGGIPFGIIVLVLVIATAIQALRLVKSPSTARLRRFIGIFTLYVLVMAMLSGSLYKSPDFWAVVVISFSFRPVRRVRAEVRNTTAQYPTGDNFSPHRSHRIENT